jgi:hypothetical protein
MLSTHTFPRKFSMTFDRISDITVDHYQQVAEDIRRDVVSGNATAIKPLIMEMCANVFTQYFTTRTFERSDKKFQQLLKNFDKIFWEVNQGYAADFLPFLLPFHYNRMRKLEQWSHEIRHFIVDNIIGDRYATWTVGNEPNDYIESLIDHVKQKAQPTIEWDTVSDCMRAHLTLKCSLSLPRFRSRTHTGTLRTRGHPRRLRGSRQLRGESAGLRVTKQGGPKEDPDGSRQFTQ